MMGAASGAMVPFASAQEQRPLERVVVTGSRIPQKGLSSPSPVSTVSKSEADFQGTTSVETLLNSLPQVFAHETSEVSNRTSGTATVNLRGLGAVRTLVLINGRRMMPASLAAPVADLNTIPIALVERIEVLTGGAAAVYGSDAVAGVVNFILRKDFEGVEMGVQYGYFDHENDDPIARARVALREALDPTEYRVPDAHVDDGWTVSAYGIMGAGAAEGKANLTAYIQYRHAESVLQSQRDFSACALRSNGSGATEGDFFAGFNCQGTSTTATGLFQGRHPVTLAPLHPAKKSTASGNFVDFNAARDTFNFSPYSHFQRPDERYLIGATGRYAVAAHTTAYVELSVADDRTSAETAPNGIFALNALTPDNFYRVNCDNPFLLAGAAPNRPFDFFCPPQVTALVGPDGDAVVSIGRRFAAGPRRDDRQHTSYRGVVGLKGDFGIGDWTYDAFGQYGETVLTTRFHNDLSRTRVARALKVVDDPVTPAFDPVCKSVLDGTDPKCVPADIFTLGALSEAAVDYLMSEGLQTGRTEETVVTAALNGSLWLASPWAERAFEGAVGGEYRSENLRHTVDEAVEIGDLQGLQGPIFPIAGGFDVKEAFAELAAPLVEDVPWAVSLELFAGYRLSQYDGGAVETYKYGATWQPVEDVRARASFQRAVRAPNVIELFTPTSSSFWSGGDPCASVDGLQPPQFTLAQCLNTGLTATQYALFSSSSTFQCPVTVTVVSICSSRIGGNPALRPEESDTTSFGVIFAPSFLKGFTATVDYFDITVDGVTGVLRPAFVLAECANTGDPRLCAFVVRAPGSGVLFASGYIDIPVVNLGSLATSGIDAEVNAKFDLGVLDLPAHALSLNLIATNVRTRVVQPLAGGGSYDCAGLFGPVCGTPTPEWRHKLRATWETPWDMRLSLAWRHSGAVRLDVNVDDPLFAAGSSSFCQGRVPCNDVPSARFRPYDYFDVAFDARVTDGLVLRGGVNNVTDNDPPLLAGPPGAGAFNGNTYPGVYDALGREVFIAVAARY